MNIMKVTQDIQRHNDELNIKWENTADDHMLALVIYTSSSAQHHTTGRTTINTYINQRNTTSQVQAFI